MEDKAMILSNSQKTNGKSSFIWNMVASVMYSAQSPLLLLAITRIMGLYEAGVFSVTYTMAHMFTNVGLYNMRSYQVSDINEENSFSDYYSSRVITTFFMIVLCFLGAIWGQYDLRRIRLVLLWSIYRSIESMEDVYHGEVQKKGRLDVVSQIVFFRVAISSLIFCAIVMIYKNMFLATSSLVASAMIIYILSNSWLKRKYSLETSRQYKEAFRLLYECFPIFISSFLYSYFVNAPKYAIDYYLSPEIQSIFTIVFLPNMLINMICIFIFKPIIGPMGQMWNGNEIKSLKELIIKYSILLIAGTIFLVIAGTLIGVPLLELIYGVNLEKYKIYFSLLMFFGGIAALNNFYSIVITIIRKQKNLILAYGVGLFMCLLVTNYAVRRYMLLGATWSFGIVMFSMFFILAGSVVLNINYSEKHEE